MKKIICDICNKEIQDDKQWNKLITQKSIANNVSKIWDVCDNCCEKIWSFMVILSSKLINGDFLQVIREIKQCTAAISITPTKGVHQGATAFS